MSFFKKLIFGIAFLASVTTNARDLIACVPEMTSKTAASFHSLVNEIATEYKDGKIIIKSTPFARSIKLAESGICDFHIPLIVVPGKHYYSSENLGETSFFIYSKAENNLQRSDLKGKRIVSLLGHEELFSFPVKFVKTPPDALRMIKNDRADAFLMTAFAEDYLNYPEFKNIVRNCYGRFSDGIVLPLDKTKRDEVDKILSDLLKKAKKNPHFEKKYRPNSLKNECSVIE